MSDQNEQVERIVNERSAREALDALNDQNRLLLEARMLPEDKALTQEQTFAVIDRFIKYVGDRGITLAQVAREVTYKDSVISQWKDNNYRGDMDKVTRAINVWMERDARRGDAKPKDYVKTWVAETIRSIVFQTDKRLMMAAVVAPAGSGKTKVLKVLAEQMRGVYHYVSANISEKDFLMELALAVGYKKDYGTKGALLRHIIGELVKTKRIIFLDEAQNLGKVVGAVRSIHDQAGVPIVMAGTADILDMVDDRSHGRGQLSSRTIRCNLLDAVSDADDPDGSRNGRHLFTEDEIKAFFATRGIRLADDALRLTWALACLPKYGTLRLAETLAYTASDANPTALTLSKRHITEALEIIAGPQFAHLLKTAQRVVETVSRARMAKVG